MKIGEYPVQYVQCRSLGHSWKVVECDRKGRKGEHISWGRALHLRCTVCDMGRIDVINAYGELGWRGYDRPDAYEFPELRGRNGYKAELVRRIDYTRKALKKSRTGKKGRK